MAAPTRGTPVDQPGGNTFTKPTGLADGDVLYIRYWEYHSLGGAATAPSGFTLVAGGTVNAGGSGFIEVRIFRKVIVTASGEPASYSVTVGTGTIFSNGGRIDRVIGADTTTPEDSGATGYNSGTGTTASSISATTTVADCLLLALIANDGASESTPTNMALDVSQDGGDAECFSRTLSGTMSAQTHPSTLGASQEWGYALVAIAPPGGGPTPWGPLLGLRNNRLVQVP